MFSRLFAADYELIVHAFDAGQTSHGILGQRLVGSGGDRSGQSDGTVFRINLD